jgi:hypothetical protein
VSTASASDNPNAARLNVISPVTSTMNLRRQCVLAALLHVLTPMRA